MPETITARMDAAQAAGWPKGDPRGSNPCVRELMPGDGWWVCRPPGLYLHRDGLWHESVCGHPGRWSTEAEARAALAAAWPPLTLAEVDRLRDDLAAALRRTETAIAERDRLAQALRLLYDAPQLAGGDHMLTPDEAEQHDAAYEAARVALATVSPPGSA